MGHALGNNYGKAYSFQSKPVQLSCNFVVDSTNGNGLGIHSLKGEGVQAVFMHSTASFTGTTTTGTAVVTGIPQGTGSLKVGMPVQTADLPAGAKIKSIDNSGQITLDTNATTGHAGATITYQAVGSPNPAAGFALVHLTYNYNRYISGYNGFVSPVSGSPILVASAGVTAGDPYVIVSLGTTTAASWHTLGVPAGVTPAVGVSFVAPLTATAAGTGAVEAPSVSGIATVEVIGDPNLSLGPIPMGGSSNVGGWILVQFLAPAASTSVMTPTAPADGSVCGLTFMLEFGTPPVTE